MEWVRRWWRRRRARREAVEILSKEIELYLRRLAGGSLSGGGSGRYRTSHLAPLDLTKPMIDRRTTDRLPLPPEEADPLAACEWTEADYQAFVREITPRRGRR